MSVQFGFRFLDEKHFVDQAFKFPTTLLQYSELFSEVFVLPTQRIDDHKHSAIGKHLRDSHNQKNKDLTEQFTILKKCRGKFECLIYEMLFIQETKPKLNTQSDSIKAKLFST